MLYFNSTNGLLKYLFFALVTFLNTSFIPQKQSLNPLKQHSNPFSEHFRIKRTIFTDVKIVSSYAIKVFVAPPSSS